MLYVREEVLYILLQKDRYFWHRTDHEKQINCS